MKVDALGKKVLQHVIKHPRATVAEIAGALEATEPAVQARLDRLLENGILRGFSAQVSAEGLGVPHEILVTCAPSPQTTRAALQALCQSQGVTRVFTLAHQNAIAFTLRGRDLQEMQTRVQELAKNAGLQRPEVTLIVDTLLDDTSLGVERAWQAQEA